MILYFFPCFMGKRLGFFFKRGRGERGSYQLSALGMVKLMDVFYRLSCVLISWFWGIVFFLGIMVIGLLSTLFRGFM